MKNIMGPHFVSNIRHQHRSNLDLTINSCDRIYEFEKGRSVDDLPPPKDVSDDEDERKGGLNKEAIEKWLNDVNVFLPNGNQPHGFETKLGMVTNGE